MPAGPDGQSTRWLFGFTDPTATEDGIGLAHSLPALLLHLIAMVFLQGCTKVKRKTAFIRMWVPNTTDKRIAYVYKLWTRKAFAERLRETGFRLAFGPVGGDAPCAGPAAARRGLTDGHRAVAGHEVPTEELQAAMGIGHNNVQLPRCMQYVYDEGVYWEVGTPCARALAIPDGNNFLVGMCS